MKIRLNEIAELAGVSKSTASRALADSPLVSDETKRRVKEIALQHSYTPNAMAQAVATKRSGILGLCLYKKSKPYFAHTFYGPLLDGAIEEASARGYHLVLAPSSDDATFDQHFIQDSIDGVILVSFSPEEAVRVFRERRIPLVLVNDALPTPNNAFIVQDNYGGARAMMEHLISRGHTKIAFMADRISHISYYLRYIAYLDVLTEHGLEPYNNPAYARDDLWGEFPPPSAERLSMFGLSPREVRGTPVTTMDNTSITARARTQEFLQEKNLPTAIFAATDSIALGVMKAVLDAGLRVPQDMAVAGYDDIAEAELFTPGLSTVQVRPYDMGQLAVQELLAQVAQPTLESRVRTVSYRLMVRGST